MVERKAFLAKRKHQYRVPQWGEPGCSALAIKMEIIMSIQVCLILSVNIIYRENGGKKSLYFKYKASIPCFLMWRK